VLFPTLFVITGMTPKHLMPLEERGKAHLG